MTTGQRPLNSRITTIICRIAVSFLCFAPVTVLAKPRLAAPAVAATAPVMPAAMLPPAPSLLALIDVAITESRFDSANNLITRARPQFDGGQLQLRTAELAMASGDVPGAATAFSALVADPDVAALALQGLGIARLRQSDLAAAKTALDAALVQDPGLARAWNARGVIADRQREWDRADAAYARAIAIAPDSAIAYTNRGYSLLLRGRHADAERDLARAVALDPALSTARTNLRFARAMQGHYTEAFDGSTRKELAADLNTVGFAAMTRGDTITAETYFNRALAINKHFDRTAWNNLMYLKQQSDAEPDPDAMAARETER